MRSPSNAVPHSMPPWSPPGPMSVFQMNFPVFASRSDVDAALLADADDVAPVLVVSRLSPIVSAQCLPT